MTIALSLVIVALLVALVLTRAYYRKELAKLEAQRWADIAKEHDAGFKEGWRDGAAWGRRQPTLERYRHNDPDQY